ncbi:hypothetical protein [Cupriavidus sp. DL-D2]|uniref:hypothetical protein n=1 Tax=Cupriavidus sp. DL-D2 TaxID=3144974 RepID=UPI0032137124
MSTEFQRLLRLRYQTEAGIRNAQRELEGINAALVALSGIKVGDVIPKYDREPDGAQMRVNSIQADVFFVDDLDKAFLRVGGTSTPITKSGQPHKSIRWDHWSRIVKGIHMPIAEYKAQVKGN